MIVRVNTFSKHKNTSIISCKIHNKRQDLPKFSKITRAHTRDGAVTPGGQWEGPNERAHGVPVQEVGTGTGDHVHSGPGPAAPSLCANRPELMTLFPSEDQEQLCPLRGRTPPPAPHWLSVLHQQVLYVKGKLGGTVCARHPSTSRVRMWR